MKIYFTYTLKYTDMHLHTKIPFNLFLHNSFLFTRINNCHSRNRMHYNIPIAHCSLIVLHLFCCILSNDHYM